MVSSFQACIEKSGILPFLLAPGLVGCPVLKETGGFRFFIEG